MPPAVKSQSGSLLPAAIKAILMLGALHPIDVSARPTLASYSVGSTYPKEASSSRFKTTLIAALVKALSESKLNANLKDVGINAAVDAVLLLEKLKLSSLPKIISFNEEGFLSLQWKTPAIGILLVFSGDQIASFSTRSKQSRYSKNVIEFNVDHPIDSEIATVFCNA